MTDEKKMTRAEAAEYWATHEITEGEGEEVDVAARKPLGVVLSLRINREILSQLEDAAKHEGVGITTMARRLLERGLASDGSTPSPARVYWVNDGEEMETLENSLELLQELLASARRKGFQISETDQEVYEKLRDFASGRPGLHK